MWCNIKYNIDFEFYVTELGNCPFQEFLDNLSENDRKEFIAVIKQVSILGFQHSQKLKLTKNMAGQDNLFELRLSGEDNEQRGLYFKHDKGKYLITHGFTKKTQKTPKKEIKRANAIKKNFTQRKRGGKS